METDVDLSINFSSGRTLSSILGLAGAGMLFNSRRAEAERGDRFEEGVREEFAARPWTADRLPRSYERRAVGST